MVWGEIKVGACHAVRHVRRVVVKFEGKSLADVKRIRRAAEAVVREVKEGVQVAVVVSAIGDTTDQLMQVAEKAYRGAGSVETASKILSNLIDMVEDQRRAQ